MSSEIEVVNTSSCFDSRMNSEPLEVDAHGEWMSKEEKVTVFLHWFIEEPGGKDPLKLIMTMLTSPSLTGGTKFNLLRLVSKQFRSFSDGAVTKIKWKGPCDNEELKKLTRPSGLQSLLAIRGPEGRFKDRFPNLKHIDVSGLDSLMDLNGCPHGLETLNCFGCNLIQSIAPLAACTNLRKLHLRGTLVSNLKPLLGCLILEWLCVGSDTISDISPLSSMVNLRVCWLGHSRVSDLSPLAPCHEIRVLCLWGLQISDLSPLSNLSHLETLICCDTNVSDLTPLSKCSELKALCIKGTDVSTLTPLLMCQGLKYLNHGNLKDQSKDETEGCIRKFSEMHIFSDSLVCTELDMIQWWNSLPPDLRHAKENF